MGKYVAVVKGGYWAQYQSVLSSIDVATTNAKDHRRIAQELSHKKNLEARAIIDALLGVAPGATALANYYEIQPAVDMGGIRVVAPTALINRATTSADVTDMKETITTLSSDTTMASPFNGDRNPLGTR